MLLFKAPSNSHMRRIINFTGSLIANAAGGVTTLVDPSLALAGLSDFTSTGALYTKLAPPRCTVTLYPYTYYATAGSLTAFGNVVAYYDPTSSAIATTYAAALDYRGSLVFHSAKPITYSVQLVNAKGTNTPCLLSEYVANFLGSLNYTAPNATYPNNTSVALIVISFACDFSSQK